MHGGRAIISSLNDFQCLLYKNTRMVSSRVLALISNTEKGTDPFSGLYQILKRVLTPFPGTEAPRGSRSSLRQKIWVGPGDTARVDGYGTALVGPGDTARVDGYGTALINNRGLTQWVRPRSF